MTGSAPSYVYILASNRNGTIYTGVTTNLIKRIWEHKEDITGGFSSRYGTKALVYYEIHASVEEAIKREKNIKAWKRRWKLELIEAMNPQWKDLYSDITK